MSDDRIRDLLQSPLDEPRRAGGGRGPIGAGMLALALGASIVLAAGLVFGGDTTPDTTQPIAATTSTAQATTTTHPAFTPSGDRLGLRPDWVLVRNGRVYVSVTSAVTAGTEPSSVARMESALWSLGTGPDRVEFITEYTDPAIPGRITVEFPAGADLTALQLIPGDTATVSHQQQVAVPSMPFTGPLDDVRFPLARAVELVIDDITVGRTSGAIAWHLEGGTTERARVAIEVDFLDGDDVLGTVLTSHSLPFFAFLRETAAPPGPTRSGVADLAITFGTSIDAERVDSARLRWTIDLFHYEQTPIDVPMEGVTRVDADQE